MKHKLQMYISGLLLFVMFTIGAGCTVVTTSKGRPRHQRRYIWVNEVHYEQVYYVNDSNTTIIVSQKEVKHKKPKHHDHGKKKGHGKD